MMLYFLEEKLTVTSVSFSCRNGGERHTEGAVFSEGSTDSLPSIMLKQYAQKKIPQENKKWEKESKV